MKQFKSMRIWAGAATLSLAVVALAFAVGPSSKVISVSLNGDKTGDAGSYPSAISPSGRYVVFDCFANDVTEVGSGGLEQIVLHDRSTHTSELISAGPVGEPGDANSHDGQVSSDGQLVVFSTLATNLYPPSSSYGQIVLRNRQTGGVELVSVSTSGESADKEAYNPSISGNGRFVVFDSLADNLVPGDTNHVNDVFLRDRQLGTTVRIGLKTSGKQTTSSSGDAAISPNGRFIVYLADGINNATGDTTPRQDVILFDRQKNTREVVSLSSTGASTNDHCYHGTVSDDGRYIAFYTYASNLVPGDTNRTGDVFVRDRVAGTTTRVSVKSDGSQLDGLSFASAISGNGRYVCFTSYARASANDTSNQLDCFVHDMVTGTTELLNVNTAGVQANGSATSSILNRDGRFAVITSGGTNFGLPDDNGAGDVILRDRLGSNP